MGRIDGPLPATWNFHHSARMVNSIARTFFAIESGRYLALWPGRAKMAQGLTLETGLQRSSLIKLIDCDT